MHVRLVLLPDMATEKVVKRYSALISSQLPALFTLDDQHIPHVTVAHIDIDDNSLKQIEEVVQAIAQQYIEISVQSGVVKADAVETTYIGAYFKDHKEIVVLRDRILRESKNLINSVSPFIDSHITITRMQRDEDVASALRLMEDFPATMIALSKIAICNSQENGTVSEIYALFTFQKG